MHTDRLVEFLRRHRAGIALGLLIAFLHIALSPLTTYAAAVTIDSTVNTSAVTHNGTTLTVAFTSDQVGYAFYRDADGTCVYRKTTNGGTSWATSTVTIDSQTDCIRIAIWYDRWTPGNTTGTKIHVVTMDTSADDLWYTYLDTSNDSTTSTVAVSLTQAATFAAGANLHALTVAGNGVIYSGVMDGADSYVMACASDCTASSSWTETMPSSTFDRANDWMLLAPLGTSSDVLAVTWDISTDDVESWVYRAASSTWTSSSTLDANCSNNTTYDGHFGLTLNKNTGDVYLASGCGMQNVGGSDDDIRTAKFPNITRTWATTTDVFTNTTSGLTGVKLGLDSNTGNIYAVYSLRSDPARPTSTDVYYQVSTSTMAGWGPRQGPINATQTDIYGLRLDGLNAERIYATWIDAPSSTIEGNTVADLTQTSFSQTSYKFFANQNATSVGPEFDFQNTPVTMANQGTPFRLRLLIRAAGEGADVGLANFKLQIATSTPGGCDTGFSGETYTDLATSTGDVRFYDNSIPLDGANLSATSTDPTDGTSTIVNQTYEENGSFSNTRAKILGDENGKWDFALVDFSAPELQTYCIRVVNSDGSNLAGYTYIPEMRKNKSPTLGTIYLNRNLDIALTEGTSTLIRATTTATDENGFNDLFNGSVKIHRSGVSSTCALNDNNCYEDQFCTFANCGGNSCELLCDVNMWFHADPTDPGTPWASEHWLATLLMEDDRGASTTASSSPVEVLTLLGLDVTGSISYGSLWVGSTTDPLSHQVGVTSTGNASMDLNIYGANMTLGTNNISINAQKFATSSVGYSSSTAFTATSTPGETVNFNVPKSISTTTRATSTSFWGIRIPSSTVSGDYTGTNAFIGVVNSLPWP